MTTNRIESASAAAVAAPAAGAATPGRFVRDPELAELLRERVLPRIAADRRGRSWWAGVGDGEPAYGLAMLFAELGVSPSGEIPILATDHRQACLRRARAAVFPDSAVAGLPNRSVERWLHRQADGYQVHDAVRQLVTFAPLQLDRDPWPQQLRLIVFGEGRFSGADEAGHRITANHAHAALVSHGWLVLTDSEKLPSGCDELFVLTDPRHPVYRRKD